MIENETLKIKIQTMLKSYQNKNFEKAKSIALSMTKEFIDHNLSWKILSCVHMIKGEMDDALRTSKQAIKINSKDPEAYNNLSLVYFHLNKFDEALSSAKEAIELKPDYAEVYFNMTVILRKLKRIDEAEANCRKAIKYKPNFTQAYSNLGIILHKLNKVEEAKFNYKKALEIDPNYTDARKNLDILNQQVTLLDIVKKRSAISLNDNLFKTNRSVEEGLVKNLYKIKRKKLDDVDPEILRYGNGESSDYNLFRSDNLIIKKLEKDLIVLIESALDSKIHIMESFFNIFKKGSGIIKHNHVSKFDIDNGLDKNKFSLVYYLSVGDQTGKEPGTLKLYEPNVEILPTDGMIMIFPADRYHTSIYSGNLDRVMIGVNFYTLS